MQPGHFTPVAPTGWPKEINPPPENPRAVSSYHCTYTYNLIISSCDYKSHNFRLISIHNHSKINITSSNYEYCRSRCGLYWLPKRSNQNKRWIHKETKFLQQIKRWTCHHRANSPVLTGIFPPREVAPDFTSSVPGWKLRDTPQSTVCARFRWRQLRDIARTCQDYSSPSPNFPSRTLGL